MLLRAGVNRAYIVHVANRVHIPRLSGRGAAPRSPQPIGLPLYKISPTTCNDCRTLTLYRSDAAVELRAYHQPSHEFAGNATATLSEATNAELDELLAALRSGEQELGEVPKDVPFDGPIIGLWLPDLNLTYAQHYPPSGLVELDALLGNVLDDLSQCRTNARLRADFGCEQLAYYPE